MKQIWQLNIEQYFEIVELAKAHGKKAGDNMEDEIFEIMNKYNIKPSGCTELTQDELANEIASKGNKVLNVKNNKPKDKLNEPNT